jgi:hypothetical protein
MPNPLNRKVSATCINRELGLLRAALRDIATRRPNAVPSIPYFPMESERNNVRQGLYQPARFRKETLLRIRQAPEGPRLAPFLSAAGRANGFALTGKISILTKL